MNLHQAKLLTSCLLLFLSFSAQAANVVQIKGSKALIDLEGDSVSDNDEFFLINPTTGKKTAVILIKQVKGEKALAEILKGSGGAGYTLRAKPSSRPMSADVEVPRSRSERAAATGSAIPKNLRPSWGILGEYIMTTMSTTFSRTTPTAHTATSDMKGNGLGAGGFYNYIFSPNFAAFGEVSLQQFNASGSTALADCNGSTSCDVKILYLSAYGLGRYYFNPSATAKVWGGAGIGVLIAATKSSSVLDTAQITTNQVFSLAAGADYYINRRNYIPFSLQLDMFPASNSVKASMMTLRAGYGWNF